MTSTAISAQGSTLQISSTTGSAKTISGASVGFPTIITSTAHGLSNGDVGQLAGFTGTDAALLNGQSVVISNVTANTFAVNIDTTGKTITVGSATFTPTNWSTIGNLKTFSGFDGKPSEIDASNMASSAKEYILGLADSGNLQIEVDQDNTDLGQVKCLSAYQTVPQPLKSFKLTLPNSRTCTFQGYVTQCTTSGGVDQIVKRTIVIRISGPFTWA